MHRCEPKEHGLALDLVVRWWLDLILKDFSNQNDSVILLHERWGHTQVLHNRTSKAAGQLEYSYLNRKGFWNCFASWFVSRSTGKQLNMYKFYHPHETTCTWNLSSCCHSTTKNINKKPEDAKLPTWHPFFLKPYQIYAHLKCFH